jgi:hypothetical protein
MAAVKKVKALVLDLDSVVEEFYDDCSLFGIHMQGEVYCNVWKVNQIFNLQFERNKYFGETNDYRFDLYQYYDKGTSINHAIYSNRKHGHTFVPQYRGFELLWLMQGHDNRFYFAETIRKVARLSNDLIACKEIDLDTFEQKSSLLF